MNIVLSHGYFLEEDEKEKAIMRPYPPLGILYLSAWLKKHGFSCQVWDSTFMTRSGWNQRMQAEKPDVLALYVNLMTRKNILDLVESIRSHPELAHIRIVLGGPEVTHHQEKLLAAGVDALVLGEGEQTLLEWIQALAEGQTNPENWAHIAGLAFLGPDRTKTTNPEREKLKDLSVLPFPDREAIDMQLYLDAWKQKHGTNAISISTMRGCPYTCKWCSRAVYGLSYRRRSPELVVAEMLWIRDAYQPDSLWFVDDVFTISYKWLEAFVAELQRVGLTMPFECITRADRMNAEVVGWLKQAGCFRVWIGAESGSQAVIDAMDRRVQVQQVRDMIVLAKAKGIQAGTFIMLGYPGETQADIEETIRHLQMSQPDYYTITLAYPIKGTELYAEVEDQLLNAPEWRTTSDRDLDFKRTFSRAYYRRALSWVNNEVAWHRHRATPVKALKYKAKSLAAQVLMAWERIR
jgi:anaerobic magnesium-protoporphyrin IX monomethyl ester cyclase